MEGLKDGLILVDGDGERLGLKDAEMLDDRDGLSDGERLGDIDGLRDGLILGEIEGERDGDNEGETTLTLISPETIAFSFDSMDLSVAIISL